MTDTGMTPNMQSWTDSLNSFGMVEIKTSLKSLTWRIGIAVAVVAAVVWVQYQNGGLGDTGLLIAIIGFAALIIGLVIVQKTKLDGKSLRIERDGVVLVSGERVPWSDITDVTVFQASRSGQSLLVNLTDAAWYAHMNKEGTGGEFMHKANKFITRNQGLVQPEYLDANLRELAAWMNQFPTGEKTVDAEDAHIS